MSVVKVNRRSFLKIVPGAGAGLYLGFSLSSESAGAASAFAPNAWLSIDVSGATTIVFAKSEMGQGVMTALPMIVADELDADWSRVKVVQGDADNKKYGSQSTGGSDSVKGSWRNLRRAGAAAREMLVAAAAAQWGVPAAECRTALGEVIHTPSGRKLGYGAVAEAAAKLTPPAEPKLKDPKDFKLIGTRMPRVDIPAKVNGSAKFGMDFKMDGLVTAVIARSPVFGGKVKSFDAAKAKAMRGVLDVIPIGDNKIAVAADTYWNAMEARKALTIEWDEGAVASLSQPQILAAFKDLLRKEPVVNRNDGDFDKAMASAAKKIECDYDVPYQSHSPMEPGNCTAWVKNGECEIWAPTQVANTVHANAAKMLNLPPEKVTVHITLLGGGFGRRLLDDYAQEAVLVSQKLAKPVKVVWSREDDLRHSAYRPASLHRMSGAVDDKGNLVAWGHQMVCPSIFASLGFPVRNGNDPQVMRQMINLYNIPNVKMTYTQANNGIPVSWWRSVYHSQTNFVEECFLDELAALAGKDPYEFRLALLDRAEVKTAGDVFDARRLKTVLQAAAAKAGWGKPLPKGRHRGIACVTAFGAYVANVVELSVEDGGYRVHKVTGALDVGQYVNPDTLAAQFESGVVFALSSLRHAVTIEKGRVAQSNFHDYPMLRIGEMPVVEVELIKNGFPPGGAGEPGVPGIAPAVANALFAATGRRFRSLPLDVGKA